MNTVKHIIWILISAWFVMSCTDEDRLIPDNNSLPVTVRTVKLNFNSPAGVDFTIARSSEITPDYLIKDLYIYVFDAETGDIVTIDENKRPAPVHYFEEQLIDGITGAQEFKPNTLGEYYSSNWIRFQIKDDAFGSDVYIYMIANTSQYTKILSDDNRDLSSITRKTELDELVHAYNNTTDIELDRTYFMMSSNADMTQGIDKNGNVSAPVFHITKDGMIIRQVSDDGKVSSEEASITLERSEAKIEFNFKSGNKGTFTPISYSIHNYPLKSNAICKYYLQMGFPNGVKIVNKDASHSEEDFCDINNRPITGSSFSFHMPENLKYPGQEYNGGQLLDNPAVGKVPQEGFKIREKHDKEMNWEYAPDYATYVEIKGTYSGKAETNQNKDQTVEAEVTYFIHLGFSLKQKWDNTYYVNDYYVRRNFQYIYNITVNGVNNIITEVDNLDGSKNVYSAEGIVTWEENITLTGSSTHALTCYKNESFAIEYTDSQAGNNWIHINKKGGADIPLDSPLKVKTDCNIKADALPEGMESRTATLRVTRTNDLTNSRTVRIYHITQKRK